MVHTPFYNILLRKAFLFSCFCGLRHCDIIALRWEDIRYDENGNALLSIIQKKTKEAISLPLCSEAIKHLPDRGNAPETEKVFAGLVSLGRSNVILHKWVEQAGISKHVTFHTARHTHATMMLTLGVDLYTVSKLLGHTNIQTTQIYAKLVDESKKKAIDLFLIYHRGWLNAKCNLSFSLILADISSIYPFSEKSELAKTAKK